VYARARGPPSGKTRARAFARSFKYGTKETTRDDAARLTSGAGGAKRDDVVDLEADADALADRVVVVRRHDGQHPGAGGERERVEELGAAERLRLDRRAPRARIVVHDVVGAKQDVDRIPFAHALGQHGRQLAELGDEPAATVRDAAHEHPLPDEVGDEARARPVVDVVGAVPLIDGAIFHDADLDDWIYTPDASRPVDPDERNHNYQFRTTFQLGTKDRFGASTDIQRHFRDQAFGQLDQGIARIEANAAMCHNDSLTQATWSRPQSNVLLFEGGVTVGLNTFGTANFGTKLDGSDYEECGQSQPFRVNIADAARGANYHGVGAISIGVSNQFNSRFAMSYVTGAHNLKSGFTIIRGNVTGNTINRADDVSGLPLSYTFTNGAPTSMTLFASRNSDQHLDHDLALFVQDQWALRRLTLSLGLRLDWMSQSLGAVDNPANALFPAYARLGAGTERHHDDPGRYRPRHARAAAECRRDQYRCGRVDA